jgi:hypothetical protein
MEARRLFQDRFVSIFSLMRDGQALATRLRDIRRSRQDAQRLQVLADVIQPYVQFFQENERCPQTGLRLQDIWRYFRHTWANPYKSIPGRTCMALVRDSAALCHPVIGIVAFSSAAVAVAARDESIGWTPSQLVAEIRRKPTQRLANWLQGTVDEAIDEIYKVDLFRDEILSPRDLKRPTVEVIAALEKHGRQQRREHHRYMQSGQYKKAESAEKLAEEHWEEQARWPLFRSKRALELAHLLRGRTVLLKSFGRRPSKEGLVRLAETGEGREALARILRKAKADHVGTAIADLTVCGAIPPYNEILGGKLVAMLMMSPEVIQEYRRRYGRIPSVIASSMAGRPVIRPADLAFIGTTSLYGQRPCQYDRISFTYQPPSNGEPVNLKYEYLGRTQGLGTFQFGPQTVEDLAILLARSKRGQQVNSVFGEGVNARLRKIRDGLNELGLPTDELLRHGSPRSVYGVRLVENVREYLLGIDKRPRYLLAQRNAAAVTQEIIRFWRERWLLPRIQRDDVLDRLARHTLVHPIRHGARVPLPRQDLEQPLLFDESRAEI